MKMEYFIGGIAGVGATCFTNPMDVVKTRLQLQGELKSKRDQVTKYRGVFHALYVIPRTDGLLALQKGLLPAMIYGFIMNSVRLGLYQVAEVQGWTKNKHGDVSVKKRIVWALIGGGLSGLFGNPALLLKTRLQAAAHPSIAVGRQHLYNGLTDGFLVIYKTEGLRGYYAGLSATCPRLSLGSVAQLTTFSAVKEALQTQGNLSKWPLLVTFVASAASGMTTALLVCPLDVAATRIYNQGSSKKEGLLYKGLIDCLSKIYRIEGIHGLYKGLGPFYCRIAPQTTLSLAIWDALNRLIITARS